MQLKMTTDYALRILAYLAEKQCVTSSTELSEQLNIPQPYVLRIGRMLKKKTYVDVLIGPFGGLALTKDPEEISIYDIVLVTEQEIQFDRRRENEKRNPKKTAPYLGVYVFLDNLQCLVEEEMKTKTLASLLA